VLGGVPDSSYLDTFFVLWTRKEAFLKARGEGLSCELKSTDVSVAPALVQGGWFLYDLAVDKGYKAAIAAKGSGFRMTHCADVGISSFLGTWQDLGQPAHQDIT
jgi:4'-phosphopantetheinyl transferase